MCGCYDDRTPASVRHNKLAPFIKTKKSESLPFSFTRVLLHSFLVEYGGCTTHTRTIPALAQTPHTHHRTTNHHHRTSP